MPTCETLDSHPNTPITGQRLLDYLLFLQKEAPEALKLPVYISTDDDTPDAPWPMRVDMVRQISDGDTTWVSRIPAFEDAIIIF